MYRLIKHHTHYELLKGNKFIESFDLNERKEALEKLYELND